MTHCYRSAYSMVRPLLWVLALLAAPAAWAQAPAAGANAAPSVGTVLNPDGTLRAGAQGSFDAAGYQLSYGRGGQPVLRTAAGWNTLGGGAAGQQNGASDPVLAVAVSGSNVYIGGNFTQAGGIAANHVARWDGVSWSPLGTGAANGVNDVVFALAISGGNVYVGGGFDQAGGAAANYVARWDGTTWNPLGADAANGVNQAVNALAVGGTGIYVGGQLTQAGGAPASYAARWNGAAWSALGPGAATNGLGDAVYALAAGSAGVCVGGQFAQAQSPAAVRLTWATASEAGSARFEVERSLNGVAFCHIGTVAAAGTSSLSHPYGLLDVALPSEAAVLYYCLRQVDLDGTATYSPVRSVQLPVAAGALAAYPNPTTGLTTLTGAAPNSPVHVFNALGQLVLTVTAEAAGTARLVLPAGLACGVYVVRAGQQALRLAVE